MNKIVFLFISFLFLSCFQPTKQESNSTVYHNENAESILPKYLGWVSDYELVFTQEEKDSLTDFLQNYSNETTNQIAILTIQSIEPYTDIKDFSTDLGNYWGVGHEGKDNGLLIVLNKENQHLRISTGKGTEKILTDAYLKTVIDSVIIPKFKEENYYEGIKFGLEKIIENWKS